MNKGLIIDRIAEHHELSHAKAERIVNEVFDCFDEALTGGDRVQISGFGSFEIRNRTEREARNPQDGSTVHVPAYKTVGFTCAKALKEKINQ